MKAMKWFRHWSAERKEEELKMNLLDASNMSTDSMGRTGQFPSLSERPSHLREFTFSELKEATKNFNRSTKIGEGGFGPVYKGSIKASKDSNQKIDVVIKQLSRTELQEHEEWVTKLNALGVAEHENLVKLIGYCAEDGKRGIQRLQVYEYMPNKSVDYHLSSIFSSTLLSWSMRLKIARDVARGLAYLHDGMEPQIIFRDFKSSNILLDENWNAKLSDFGLARLGHSEVRYFIPSEYDSPEHIQTGHSEVRYFIPLGYDSPEYIQTGQVTRKLNVWNYGVFLYELITGRRPLDRNRPKNEQQLLEWVKPHTIDRKKIRKILDPRLRGNFLRSAHELSLVANKCLAMHPMSRPTMSEVLEMVDNVV